MRGLIAALLALVSLSASAGDVQGEAALGFLATDGNTHSKSLNAKLDLAYTELPWHDTLQASAINASGSAASDAERYLVGNKLARDFTPRDYVFLALEFEKDLVGATRMRTSETLGYGRHVLTGPKHLLDLEIGAGVRQTEANVTRDKHSDPIARGTAKYQWKISDTSSLVESAKTETGADNTFAESITELRMPVAGDLSAVLSYTVRFNSAVPPGVHHTDTAASAALAYSFGGDEDG
jgi:putative salt-induced outer membrane protein